MTGEKREKYELDLSRSRSPRAFRGKENLWRTDLGRIFALLESHVELIGRNEGGPEEDRLRDLPTLAVAVFGPSGSGKSSLLRTLADQVRSPHRTSEEGDSEGMPTSLRGRVATLDVLDPTTWSSEDQFLYAFLATALEEENRRFERQGGAPQGLSPVQLAFQGVNEYLQVVDAPAKSDEYDPLGLSLQKLERHTSGIRLRRNLDKLIVQLAKSLGASVVLFPVDDLDMAPRHLVAALQTYQSFLAHPRLVPVFTFTDRMAEELAEVHFDQLLRSPNGVTHRRPRSVAVRPGRLAMHEAMAVQFLARTFPVRNRIRLGPAPARVQQALFRAQQAHAGPEEERGQGGERGRDRESVLDLLIISSFLLFGHPDQEDTHKVRAALRPSTLRRQLQVVDAMDGYGLRGCDAPQFAYMANPEVGEGRLLAISGVPESRASGAEPPGPKEEEACWKNWKNSPKKRRPSALWRRPREEYPASARAGLERLERRLSRDGRTWASLFDATAWSLLNVHRDTLRELDLHLEDLYSWSPRELRSVVLGKILGREREVRRAVFDRWFNRTDYRRGQVLSLLAANVYRPWMPGEEAQGDDQVAIRAMTQVSHGRADRSGLRVTDGLLWFTEVVLGFYLPQVLARDWEDVRREEPLAVRMSGNGWDLRHAPISAVQVADARQEVFSFGMVFLRPDQLRTELGNLEKDDGGDAATAVRLRLWTCLGCSRGRFWSAFSLWRGLGFIGEVLEMGLRHTDALAGARSERSSVETAMPSMAGARGEAGGDGAPRAESAKRDVLADLRRDLKWLIRDHCLSGLVGGPHLGQGDDDRRLVLGFPRWEPRRSDVDRAVTEIARELVDWLVDCRGQWIHPLPFGDLWVGWRDCFVRRIHGDSVIGALGRRLDATYLEEWVRNDGAAATVGGGAPPIGDRKYVWTAAVAASAWSDVILEYWRGCPGILYALLTCPVFPKSRENFGRILGPRGGATRLAEDVLDVLVAGNVEPASGSAAGRAWDRLQKSSAAELRLRWLNRLRLPVEAWESVRERWQSDGIPESSLGFSDVLVRIERADPQEFRWQGTGNGGNGTNRRGRAAADGSTGSE